ncbi:MAG: ABC transporter permease [Cyclobacteriaceae bacterium]|nr:ABC transporter permease [Cyclobacteriaceae bacterium]
MNLPFFIAKRYLFSKRKKNFINIISWLSVMVVAFITAALVIVMSVFNGLGDLLRNLNNAFDPEIKIEAAAGKTFMMSDSLLQKITAVEGVEIVTEVLEDYAYLRYREANQIITLKGVSENFIDQNRINNSIVAGKLALRENNTDYALVGRGVEYNLSIAVNDPLFPLQLYYIKNTKLTGLDPSKLYSKRNIIPGAVFSIVQNFDDNYVIVPLGFAQDLMDSGNKRTSLEIKTKPGANQLQVQERLKKVLGQAFTVLNHEEQHQDLYRLLNMEKLFTFLAFTILLGIGAINIFFSLMMLALDKKKDISVLMAMGADGKLIKKIFVSEGVFIAMLGTSLGLLLGALLVWAQMQFGLVSMGMESAITEGYPIKPVLSDFLLTLGVVAIITILISLRPAHLAARAAAVEHL